LLGADTDSPIPGASGALVRLLFFTSHDDLVHGMASNAGGVADNDRNAARPVASRQLINEIYRMSGLTWQQISRALGVSNRSVLLWARGGKISGRNLELLAEFERLVASTPAETPEERRVSLLASHGASASRLTSFMKENLATGNAVNSPSATPAELLG
jgi:hypothetical protein